VPLLELPQPYYFEVSTERFRAFGVDLANVWHEGGLHRVIEGREVRIEPAPHGVQVEPMTNGDEPVVLTLLGAPFDLASFYEFAQADPVLRGLVGKLAGLRPPLAPDPLEALVGSITAQQVSMYAAFAIRSRLIERFGERAQHAWAFPTRERLAAAREEELVALGFSRRKAEYVVALARSDLDFEELGTLSDEEAQARIVSQRGLGEWSADWFLARHLARPRAWPAGDLALRKALSAYYGNGRELTTGEVRALGERFEPFQNLSAHYLLTGSRMVGT
jgi:3-methyladenine DNA glycosylase/8-oxoguanine DNA glycosylase